MKRRWVILLGLAIFCALGILLIFLPDFRARKTLADTQRALRQARFKIDLSEFDLSITPAQRARADALTTIQQDRNLTARQDPFDPMAQVGYESALVIWKQDKVRDESGVNLWPLLSRELDGSRYVLDNACAAALSGPIRFNLEPRNGNDMVLPHLMKLRNLLQLLNKRVILNLYAGEKDLVWTDLLAATRLVSAYEPEPAEVSHLVRYRLAAMDYNITWQALQADGWTDERLAALQQEWESVDYFKPLPETAAFTRASWAAACELARHRLFEGGMSMDDVLHHPEEIGRFASFYWEQIRYLNHGSYLDETTLLLYYRDRELELRKVIQSPTWIAMRTNRVGTNAAAPPRLISRNFSALMNTRQLGLAWQTSGYTQLARAAEAEARRRLVITAIAIERFRVLHGSYPGTLGELSPRLLTNALPDFIDGRPLRYRLTDDGHFVLYSVGLNGVDDGGKMPAPIDPDAPGRGPGRGGRTERRDLVWPRPATPADLEAAHREKLRLQALRAAEFEDYETDQRWHSTAMRQRQVEKILAANATPAPVDPIYKDRLLSETIQNPAATGTNKLTLQEMLAIRPVLTGKEPEIATFELPLRYDVLTNIGTLCLYVDPTVDLPNAGCYAGQWECQRASNGNCLLVWNTVFESSGKHAIQIGLSLGDTARGEQGIFGPIAPFVITNLCQFSLGSAYFNPDLGATLNARLPEMNGDCIIEFKSPAGQTLKTITGSTATGVLKVHWDLLDDHGGRFTNEYFNTVFHLTLPASGRTQTLNGP